jgi:hypothetical protein
MARKIRRHALSGFCKAKPCWVTDAPMISQMKALEDKSRRLKRMVADLSMQADLLREALVKKVNQPSVDQRQMVSFAAGQRRGPLGRLLRNRLAGQRRAVTVVARRGIAIAQACPLPGRACMSERGAFGVGESCHHHSPRLGGENEEMADLLIGLTNARKTRGFGLCFLYLHNVQGRRWNHKRGHPLGRQVIADTHRQADHPRAGAEPAEQAPQTAEGGTSPMRWRSLTPRTRSGRLLPADDARHRREGISWPIALAALVALSHAPAGQWMAASSGCSTSWSAAQQAFAQQTPRRT